MSATDTTASPRARRFAPRMGPVIVALALVLALASFAVFTGYTPIAPTDAVVLDVFAANALIVVVLLILVGVETLRIVASWRARVAGARLHLYIIGLFSIIAAVPAIIMAVVGSVTLERGLYPAFMQDVRGFISHTADAARLYRETQCHSLLREADLTASDLDRAKVGVTDRSFFQNYFASRVHFLGFTTAVMMKSDGSITAQVDTGLPAQIVPPSATDFDDAKKHEPVCFVLDEGKTFVALRVLPSFDDTYLYLGRPVDPFAIEFDQQAQNIIGLYDAFDQHRRSIQFAFISMFGLLALIMLLSAIWLGLSFANTLAAPIRRLIRATDQVSSGNLYVQVPIRRAEGDLAHLGETFNNMTSELRHHQNRLIEASRVLDERRMFTEAVLSGVPAAVIGVSADDAITVLNPFARKLLALDEAEDDAVGQPFADKFPELAPMIVDAKAARHRMYQAQVTLVRSGRERNFNVRVTAEASGRSNQSYVVTLDDITDLVSAQRTSAWADVARRIAHEIKNPLTPIQLSAERLKRRYGRVITEGRDVFDQCTDTIIRQVDDIKRMVDEFSSFARMPKATLDEDDLTKCVQQVLFLMRVGHPDLSFEAEVPDEPVRARFDRRLLTQALTNIVKNATEGIAAADPALSRPAIVTVALKLEDGTVTIDVDDTGKGFPTENRQRLLEPYMTTRAEGTGLGLPIVAKILEDHGGGLDLLDNDRTGPAGGGARVRLFWPARGPGKIQPTAAEAAEPMMKKA
ncbi:PAS domain-containing sensor histidine kinase [Lichenihabitans sp. Uapishka_5]|uniref:sensor histidine kinase NtrY-like n=1 Tax=Lichenihabitans sp. Uapishka_5 TaxID=3037302 RepID=UPI0029E7D649|nr:PAS domain-containing sensor histidine kinase [Lichenihabitans sp. Uapishka_5]MDX7949857.1 PAS domain-containing sensor histidine kinase [Lichenihabitans sp. Uapishka_5]